MLLRLRLLHRDTTTTVLALFPFLRLTFSLLGEFGRMRTMAKLLLVSRYFYNVRSQSTSCKSDCCMSRCCEILLRIACVPCTCFITPNRCPCLMRTLPVWQNDAIQRRGGQQENKPLSLPCRARWAAHGQQPAAMRHAPRRQSRRRTMLPSSISSSGPRTILPSLFSRNVPCRSIL
jgi:hypothetical protein